MYPRNHGDRVFLNRGYSPTWNVAELPGGYRRRVATIVSQGIA